MTCLLARYYFDNWTLYSSALCYEHVRLSWNFNEPSNTATLLLGTTLGAAGGTPGTAAAPALIHKRSGRKEEPNHNTQQKPHTHKQQGITFFKSKAGKNACSTAKASLSWDLRMVKGQNHCTAPTQQPVLEKPAQGEKHRETPKDGGPGTSPQTEWQLIPINLSKRCI